MPPKRPRVTDESPLDEGSAPASPEDQVTLTEVLQTLRLQNDEMRNLIKTLHERIQTLEDERSDTPAPPNSPTSSVSSISSVRRRDPKVAPPDPFTGKVAEFQNFIAQCTLTLTLCPKTYSRDEDRVLFVISRLRGTPLTWAHDIIFNPEHPLRKDYPAFKMALTNLYGDRAYEMECEDKIKRLEQTGSAVAYAQNFQTLMAPLGLDKKSQCLMFFGGLKAEVKKAIIIAGRSTEFQDLVNQAVKFDQLFYQQLRQEKRESQDDPSPPNKKRQQNRATDSQTPANTTPPFVPLPDTTPHFRAPLTEKEKEHRRQNNLCAYCGDSGHAIETCPRVKKKNDFAQNSTPNSNNPSLSNVNNPKPHSPLLYPVPTRPFSAPPNSENWQSQPPRM
jgi:Ty3 transposon capsid-like protein